MLAIDVAPTFDVPWAEDGLPSARSFDRAALTERFGARPAGLDGADVETVGSADVETGDGVGLALAGAAVAGWVLSLVAVGGGTFLLTRERYRRTPTAAPAGYWGDGTGPAVPPVAWAPAPSAPGHQRPPNEPAPQAVHDPWKPLG